MNWRDVQPGVAVYHSLMTHWGQGIVQKVVMANMMERMFERGTRRVIVEFDGLETPTRMQLSSLRKTPNRKKIRHMVRFYQSRGVDAKDGGDRLVIPAGATAPSREGG